MLGKELLPDELTAGGPKGRSFEPAVSTPPRGKDSIDGTKNHVGSNKKEGKMSRHGGAIRILS